MPREPYSFKVSRDERLARKPYDRPGQVGAGAYYNEEEDDGAIVTPDDEEEEDGAVVSPDDEEEGEEEDTGEGPYNMRELGDALDEPAYPPINGDIYNPTRARNNCFHLGLGYATGQHYDDVEDRVGPPPPADLFGFSKGEMDELAPEMGVEISKSPPDEHYMEGEREAAAAYEVVDGGYHWVAIDGGSSTRDFTYTDYQEGSGGHDVTDEVRKAGGPSYYMTRPTYDELEEERDRAYDDDLEEKHARAYDY